MELSLEVQGGQDYFICGRNLYNCLCSFFFCSLLYPLHIDSELTQTLKPEDSYLERKRRSFQKHNSTPPPFLWFFSPSYKAQHDKKGKSHGFGKSYNNHKGKKREAGGGSKSKSADGRCFKCGSLGHFANDCKKGDSCYKCGKAGHKAFECTNAEKEVTCYNCRENGHISTKCTKPKGVCIECERGGAAR